MDTKLQNALFSWMSFQNIKNQLSDIVKADAYGLKEKTLYDNIKRSTGTTKTLSELFAVPESLVVKIKRNNFEDWE